jgi:hypothetical protein
MPGSNPWAPLEMESPEERLTSGGENGFGSKHSAGYGLGGTKTNRQWRPSKTAVIATAAGLVLVAALAFGLIFGLPDSESSSSVSATSGSATCDALEDGKGVTCDRVWAPMI